MRSTLRMSSRLSLAWILALGLCAPVSAAETRAAEPAREALPALAPSAAVPTSAGMPGSALSGPLVDASPAPAPAAEAAPEAAASPAEPSAATRETRAPGPRRPAGEGTRVKVALAQIDTTVADFDYNVRHIIRFIKKAGRAGADVVVFPELALTGYPPRDLLEAPGFADESERALAAIQREVRLMPDVPRTIVLGSVTRTPGRNGRPLQNSALVIHDGEVVHSQAKRLLPNYDVFDEVRYFEPGRVSRLWASPWGKLAFTICEDAWHAVLRAGRRLYRAPDPALALRGAPLHFNVMASPYEIGKQDRREDVFGGFARRAGSPVVAVNSVGAQDDILFDGGSRVYGRKGEVLYEMPRFKEGLGLVDLELGLAPKVRSSRQWEWSARDWRWRGMAPKTKESEIAVLHRALVEGIRGYFLKVGYDKAVLGLSGGVDSSVVASLAVDALGADKVVGVLMPSRYNSDDSITDAELLAKNLGIKTMTLPIQGGVDEIKKGLDAGFADLDRSLPLTEDDTTEDNIQARLRAILLLAAANRYDMLMLATSNKSELAVGQTTSFGDMSGALAPIGDLFKTRVYEMARYINSRKRLIPDGVLTKPASAQLAPGQTDEAKFGPWSQLDPVLEMHIEKQLTEDQIVAAGFDRAYVKKTIAIVRGNEFKRRLSPIILKVTPKAFGSGRRIPISSYFRPVRDPR